MYGWMTVFLWSRQADSIVKATLDAMHVVVSVPHLWDSMMLKTTNQEYSITLLVQFVIVNLANSMCFWLLHTFRIVWHSSINSGQLVLWHECCLINLCDTESLRLNDETLSRTGLDGRRLLSKWIQWAYDVSYNHRWMHDASLIPFPDHNQQSPRSPGHDLEYNILLVDFVECERLDARYQGIRQSQLFHH
jgi:hypothetical protein